MALLAAEVSIIKFTANDPVRSPLVRLMVYWPVPVVPGFNSEALGLLAVIVIVGCSTVVTLTATGFVEAAVPSNASMENAVTLPLLVGLGVHTRASPARLQWLGNS